MLKALILTAFYTCKAYFTDGIYLDIDALVTLAVEWGLDGERARQAITNPQNLETVVAKNKHWRNNGVAGIRLKQRVKLFLKLKQKEEWLLKFSAHEV